MAIKFMMKNPVLMIGILMMIIFILNTKRMGFFNDNDRFNPTSCKSAIVMLQRRAPDYYKVECQKNDMVVRVKRLDNGKMPEGEKGRKKLFYMELANHLTFIARNSYTDSLQNVDHISLIFDVGDYKINTFTKGIDISRLSSLTDVGMISLHLRNTVKIQEITKSKN